MSYHDPYLVENAFDDVYGDEAVARAPVDRSRLAHQILSRAHARRLHVPVRADVVGVDSTRWTFAPIGCDVLGADVEPAGPLFNDLHRKFSLAATQPKVVRVDTPESYADFRDARRELHLRRFEERLRRVEDALARHVGDRYVHVHGYDDLDETVLGALDEAHDAATHGGVPIHLPIPACEDGRVRCWQDDSEIVCTVAVPTADGCVLITSGTPVDRHVEEMMGCVLGTDAEPEDLLAVATPVIQTLGVTALIQEICGAAGDLLRCASRGVPVVGVIQSQGDPAIAAGMALLQRCQQGDRRACAEALAMAQSRKHKKLINRALECLLEGQRQVAAQRSAAGRYWRHA